MNADLIHKWLRDRKFAPAPETLEDEVGETPCFLPVEIVDRPATEEPAPARVTNAASGHSVIEIDIAGGHQLRVVGSYDPEALARLIRGLSA